MQRGKVEGEGRGTMLGGRMIGEGAGVRYSRDREKVQVEGRKQR